MPYIVRTDWLEKLGIESPVTLEDWENYWHLVKTTRPERQRHQR